MSSSISPDNTLRPSAGNGTAITSTAPAHQGRSCARVRARARGYEACTATGNETIAPRLSSREEEEGGREEKRSVNGGGLVSSAGELTKH